MINHYWYTYTQLLIYFLQMAQFDMNIIKYVLLGNNTFLQPSEYIKMRRVNRELNEYILETFTNEQATEIIKNQKLSDKFIRRILFNSNLTDSQIKDLVIKQSFSEETIEDLLNETPRVFQFRNDDYLMEKLCCHQNLSESIIDRYFNLFGVANSFLWRCIWKNQWKNISQEYIKNKEDLLNWNFIVSFKNDLDLNYIVNNFHRFNIKLLITNRKLPIDFIEQNLIKIDDFKIKKKIVRYQKESISEDFLRKYIEDFNTKKCWLEISNMWFSEQFVEDYLDKYRIYDCFRSFLFDFSENLSEEFFKRNIDRFNLVEWQKIIELKYFSEEFLEYFIKNKLFKFRNDQKYSKNTSLFLKNASYDCISSILHFQIVSERFINKYFDKIYSLNCILNQNISKDFEENLIHAISFLDSRIV